MINKGFVDLLFILLCATIVMLSQSVQLGSLDLAPARVGGGAISRVTVDDVVLMVVDREGVALGEQRYADAERAAAELPEGACVLLSPGHEAVGHHRVMRVWSSLHEAGVDVRLAASESSRAVANTQATHAKE